MCLFVRYNPKLLNQHASVSLFFCVMAVFVETLTLQQVARLYESSEFCKAPCFVQTRKKEKVQDTNVNLSSREKTRLYEDSTQQDCAPLTRIRLAISTCFVCFEYHGLVCIVKPCPMEGNGFCASELENPRQRGKSTQ